MLPKTIHVPVLPSEVIHWLDPQPAQIIADGTLGGGGHTRLIAERVTGTGQIIALDRDPDAVERAESVLSGLPVKVAAANYCELPEILSQLGIGKIDGILLDLGLSSDQLADAERGFSFSSPGPLDLRFNRDEGEPAWKLINRLSAEHLANLIYQYGEERYSRRIARKIVEQRRGRPIQTTSELAELVRRCIPRKRPPARIDPATRTFQAFRIAVNEELKSLETALRRLPDCLAPGGRFVVISFHSLEDRLVKEAFRSDRRLESLTKKPIRPSEEEIEANPRSRSARLRVGKKLSVKTPG